MKYTIIVGFLATILAVSASTLDRYNLHCVKHPNNTINALEKCTKVTPIEVQKNFLLYDKTQVTREAKCFALCLYFELGVYADGEVDPIALENNVRQQLGSHPFVDKVVEINLNAAKAANADPGDNCDRAFAYHAALDNPYSQLILTNTFCPLK